MPVIVTRTISWVLQCNVIHNLRATDQLLELEISYDRRILLLIPAKLEITLKDHI